MCKEHYSSEIEKGVGGKHPEESPGLSSSRRHNRLLPAEYRPCTRFISRFLLGRRRFHTATWSLFGLVRVLGLVDPRGKVNHLQLTPQTKESLDGEYVPAVANHTHTLGFRHPIIPSRLP